MTRLGRENWIDAALRRLVHAGIDSVRVEALARALKVTKGSFYWHFTDRPALLSAMLETWQARATDAIISQVEAQGGDVRERLARLFSITVRADARLERAVRGWAAQDEAAAQALASVDRRRIGYLVGLFGDLGFRDDEALARARLGYLALIGQYMSESQPAAERPLLDSLPAILALLTACAHPHAPPT